MELRDYIDKGVEKAGTLTALGKEIGLTQQEMTNARGHRRGLPMTALSKLQKYIKADLEELIAANELVTEKKEEKRNYWSQFIEHARAAVIAGTIAGAINFWTPSPAEAAPIIGSEPERFVLCKVRKSKKRQLNRLFKGFLKSFFSLFAMRTPEPKPI